MKKRIARIMAAALAVLMIGSACAQLFAVVGSAAGTVSQVLVDDIVYRNNTSTSVSNMRANDRVNITLSYFDQTTELSAADIGAERTSLTLTSSILGTGFKTNSNSRMSVSVTDYNTSTNTATIVVHIQDVTYQSAGKRVIIKPTTITLNTGTSYVIDVAVDIPDNHFSSGGGNSGGNSGDGDSDIVFTPDILIETVYARDKDGKILEEITEDTEAFTLEVVYTDRGFTYDEVEEFMDDDMLVYLTDAGDFIPTSNNRGTIKRVSTAAGNPPRFRATFENMKYAGGTTTYGVFTFRVQYIVYGEDITGSASARLYGVVNDDDDDDETAPPTPYIILDSYSMGDDQIEAGATFTLGMQFKNTSKEVEVENIRLMINPAEREGTTEANALSIASETNTYYYETLQPQGAFSQSVDILVKGSATVGSQALNLDFTFEYVVDKERKSGTTSTTIYIPITQIDRFTVDPITDFSSWMELGSDGYASVSFVNRGKSTTYNVSGYVVDAEGNQGQTEHHGNLEAGASGMLDFTITPSMPGDYEGTIIIMYEDENGEEKEIPVTFAAFVEEPWYPTYPDPGEMDPGWTDEETSGTPWWKYTLFGTGGLAIAAPMALYIAKRTLLKGKEDFDEDF